MSLKKFLLIIIAILGIGGIIIYKTVIMKPLLTGNFESLDKVVIQLRNNPENIMDGYSNYVLTTKKNKDQVLKIYDEVLKAKTSTIYYQGDGPQNDPFFQINFIYRDKSVDNIYCGEDHSMVYNAYPDDPTMWVSGKNINILRTIEEITKHIYWSY